MGILLQRQLKISPGFLEVGQVKIDPAAIVKHARRRGIQLARAGETKPSPTRNTSP